MNYKLGEKKELKEAEEKIVYDPAWNDIWNKGGAEKNAEMHRQIMTDPFWDEKQEEIKELMEKARTLRTELASKIKDVKAERNLNYFMEGCYGNLSNAISYLNKANASINSERR